METTSQLTTAIELAANMLKKLEKEGATWTVADDKKLEKLTKIVGVLTKLLPIEEKGAAKKSVTLKEDKEIIRRYLERKKKK